MTLQNLKEALYQNNLILLDKINNIKKNYVQKITDEEVNQAITDTLKELNKEE